MSFLNQLKTQAKALQTQRTDHEHQIEERTAETEKACSLIASYLDDLARQLSVIQPPAPAFTLDGRTPWPAMKLADFRVDARRKMLRNQEVFDYIAMGWRVVPQVGGAVGGIVMVNFPPDMQRVEDRLAIGMVKHERREVRHPEKNVLQEVRYHYLTQTRGSVVVTPDHDEAQVQFRLVNTRGFELAQVKWPPARIVHDLLDELAKRIVGQDSLFA
jgi:hypothetical protein